MLITHEANEDLFHYRLDPSLSTLNRYLPTAIAQTELGSIMLHEAEVKHISVNVTENGFRYNIKFHWRQ